MRKGWKRALSLLTACCISAGALYYPHTEQVKTVAADSILAFPGAVGGGRYATGGRGGEVVHVTNLNDSGAGSFREAVSKSNRIVVFDVSGTIELQGNILVSDNVTIAGQTAPGGSGITLKNYKMGMSGNNIICRFVSSRPGPYKATSSGNDAWGGAKGSNSIIDHCSLGWTTDEQWGIYSNNEYYTVQYSVIGPADSWGGHSKGIHGFGLMMGKGYCTFDHNLIVHNVSRNFRGKVVGTETADFTNNIIYNWAYQTAYGTIGHLNYVNNTLKMGNGTTGGKHYVYVDSSTSPQNFSIFCQGNRMLNKDGSVYGDVTYDNWNGINVKSGLGITKDSIHSQSAFTTLVNGINVSTATTCESAEDSYEHVLSFAGNGISDTQRTKIDQQCAYECRTGTGSFTGTASYSDADSSDQANISKYGIVCDTTYEYPSSVLAKTITDSDNDGMPDEWELARGLNPNDAGDTNGDYCGQGYTNIEYYINDLTINAFPEGVVTLSPEATPASYTSAFTQIEAEDFDKQSGILTESCSDIDGGENVGYIENGDYLFYKNLDFEDGAKSFSARISGNACAIELYLDSLTTPVATINYKGSGSFSKWEDFSTTIPTISGKHSLYLKFVGGDGYLANLNRFTFGTNAVAMNGSLFTNLYILDEDHLSFWSLSDHLSVGDSLFGDRDVTYATLPSELIGAEYIKTSCDSKYTSSDLARFTAGEDMYLYVALDTRVETIPEWMRSFEKTDLTCTNSSDVSFTLYKTSVDKGTEVILGSNGQSSYCVNYVAFALEKIQETTTTTTTTTTTIITTTTTDAVDTVLLGDVNVDGSVSTSDAVFFNKILKDEVVVSAKGAINADMDKDGSQTSSDLAILLKYLCGIIKLEDL